MSSQRLALRRVLKTRCPRCGKDIVVEIGDEILREARENPLGMAGIVEMHGDHAAVVYIDRNGNERGVRVYSVLAKGGEEYTVFTLPPASLRGFSNIAGFALTLRKLRMKIQADLSEEGVMLHAVRGDAVLDLDFRRDFSWNTVKRLAGVLVDTIDSSYSENPNDYLSAIKILDVILKEPNFLYSKQVFWLVTNASTLSVRTRLPEAMLFRKYRPSMLFERYDAHFLLSVAETPRESVAKLLKSDNPYTVYSRADALLAMYKRGIIDIEVVG